MSLPQLKIRSEFSFRRAFGSPSAIASRLKAIQASVGGLVDANGSTWGHVRFEKAMLQSGVQAAFGAEWHIAVEDEFSDKRKFKTDNPTAWALAEDTKLFYNFSSSNPNTPESFAGAKGVIRFSGAALTDPACFDYIDLTPSSVREVKRRLELHRKTLRPYVLVGDNHYPAPTDRDAYLSLIDGKKTTPQWIMSDDEMRNAFWFLPDDVYDEAYRNTMEVGERLQGVKLRRAPVIDVPGDLAAMVAEGKAFRLGKGHIPEWTDAYQARLEREMMLIHEKAYESYFIVVSDLVTWAKDRMLVGPARGSSAGSLVCYLLRITEVDPLVHNLIFERFIDINRNDLPDIDIDFSDQKRELCFEYLIEKYGAEHIARIGNISTLRPRSVMAEVGKKMAIPANATFAVRNVLLEYSSGDSRYGKSLEDTMTLTKPGQEFMRKYPEAEVMALVEGHASHSGVHAAGVLVCHEPITDYCTVRDGVAQLDKPDTEHLNLLKIDALGLRTLGVLEDSGCLSNDDFYNLKLDDPEVLKIFDERKFSGIFQFEGAAQRRVSIQIPMKSFKQIDHVTALARPGPLGGGATNAYIKRNDGREEVTYRHPALQKYMNKTMGVVLYQEQIMQVCREIGQMSWELVSEIRKSMSGRKGKEYFDRAGDKFKAGAIKTGLTEKDADEIWAEFCSYGAWCLSGDTIIEIVNGNQHQPTSIKLRDLAAMRGSTVIGRKKIKVWSMNFDRGVMLPTRLLDAFYSGQKETVLLKTADGRSIRATGDHQFWTPLGWRRLADMRIDEEIAVIGGIHQREGKHKLQFAQYADDSWRRKLRQPYDGRSKLFKFRREALIANDPTCARCGAPWKNCHHKDGNRMNNDWNNLELLCNSCHKAAHREMDGHRCIPFAAGRDVAFSRIVFIGKPKTEDVYDISMPAPHHNFVANGYLAHNCMNASHTTSYAIISYWCAFMKRYHPIEYAAACLRNAKDEDQQIEILRELQSEGISFIAFDPELSERNWIAKDGMLVGGFTNLVGIGPAKAEFYVQKRSSQGLTPEDVAKLRAYPVKNRDLQPAHSLWGQYYADPSALNVAGRIKQFAELTDFENSVVICKVVRKERRDENETIRAARRGGQLLEGQTQFLDVFVVDDSVSKPVLLRLKTKMWESHGEKMADRAIDGQDWFLVRGKWLEQFSMLSVMKIKCLTNPEMFD